MHPLHVSFSVGKLLEVTFIVSSWIRFGNVKQSNESQDPIKKSVFRYNIGQDTRCRQQSRRWLTLRILPSRKRSWSTFASVTAEHSVSNRERDTTFPTQVLMNLWRDVLGSSEDVRHASLSKHVVKLGRSGGLLTRRIQLQTGPLYLATLVRCLPCGCVKKAVVPRWSLFHLYDKSSNPRPD